MVDSKRFEDSYLGSLRKSLGNQTLISPGARIILINAKDEVLLQLRADFKVWGLPGGSPEIGESIFQCIQREVMEETGLILNSAKAFGFSSNPKIETIEYPNKDKVQGFSLLFYSKDWSGELLSDNSESLDLRFFKASDIPQLHLHSLDKYSFELFHKFKQSKHFQVG